MKSINSPMFLVALLALFASPSPGQRTQEAINKEENSAQLQTRPASIADDATSAANSGENDFIALNERGMEQVSAGQYKEAIASFNKAIRLSPQASELHFNLGVAYSYLKR